MPWLIPQEIPEAREGQRFAASFRRRVCASLRVFVLFLYRDELERIYQTGAVVYNRNLLGMIDEALRDDSSLLLRPLGNGELIQRPVYNGHNRHDTREMDMVAIFVWIYGLNPYFESTNIGNPPVAG